MGVSAGATRLVAIDPGEIHVGMALFCGMRCYEAYEVGPDECVDRVAAWLATDALDVVVVESFRLYPWQSGSQHWSGFGTVEVIGVLRYLVRLAHAKGARVKWVEQPASIKKPTRAIVKAKGIKRVSKGSTHALDAELHGHHWTLRSLETETG